MKNKQLNNAIGTQLKLARQTKGWSLDKTSEFTNVSKAMLGQIERGESSPTISKMWDIANGFKYPLSYFLSSISNETNDQVIEVVDEGIEISTLFPFNSVTNIEVFLLSLAPMHQQISLPHNEGVVEHILVIKGKMEYLIEDTWRVLNTGDVVKFNANVAHGYRNMSEETAVFHNIISYPKP